jgi:predicted transcriptional regulator of viral defense system
MVDNMSQQKTLGKVSAKLIAGLYDQNKPIFTPRDAAKIISKEYNQVTDLLSELARRRVLQRLKSGKYQIIPQQMGSSAEYIGNWFVAAREVVNSPLYYVGFYSAMNFWGMLTQPLFKIYVVTTKRQIVPREMKDRLTFVLMKKKFIWGVREEWVTQSERVRISDLEKTILDALAHPEYCGGITEIAKGIWIAREKINFEKMQRYVAKYEKNVVAKRLGYVLDLFGIERPELLRILCSYVKDRYDVFDPGLTIKRVNKNKWRLIDNVGQKQILDIVRH